MQINNIKEIIKSANLLRSWPFQEAERILKKIDNKVPEKGYVLFESGYAPSGLPHIGTFGEMVRTNMVRYAFEQISDIPTKLFCISDDMDGLRSIPDIIGKNMGYEQYIGVALSDIPNPFKSGINGKLAPSNEDTFASHMNKMLCRFLDQYGFEYEFKSATECYKNGVFNEGLIAVLKHYDEIMELMLSTLRDERRKTYSPFMPIDKKTRKVLQVPTLEVDVKNAMISYQDPHTGEVVYTKVTDGHCKLQWKPDFGMRWFAFDVDFEMYGKDHLTNGDIYSRICEILGGTRPQQMFYELFLDEEYNKMSKSKNNSFTLDDWMMYAPKESLTLFMYLTPQKAKRLYYGVIPYCVDECIKHISSYHSLPDEEKICSPVYHIYKNSPVPSLDPNITYSLLLNLITACDASEKESNLINQFIKNYLRKKYQHSKETLSNAKIDEMVEQSLSYSFVQSMLHGAIRYYCNFIKPNKKYKTPDDIEKAGLLTLRNKLLSLDSEDQDVIQQVIYDAGREVGLDSKKWFQSLYEMLLGSSSGPRFGFFISVYGVKKSIEMIENVINSENGK